MKNISALMEIFPAVQKLLFNTIDLHSIALTRTQMFILFALSSHKSLNMSQISSYIASSKEQATRAVAPLVKYGYVQKFHMGDNRRKVYVCLTPQGKEFIEQEQRLVKDRLAGKFDLLSEDDKTAFYHAVDDILHILRKLENDTNLS
nr:MarR family transcriptional regulator [uncultured Anaerostipes sp.]